MYFIYSARYCLVFSLAVLATLGAAAQGPPPEILRRPIPKSRAFDLQITNVQPVTVLTDVRTGALLEHQDIQVNYRLAVTSFGIVGELSPQDGLICASSRRGTCARIRGLDPGRTYEGTIQTTAPAAGAAALIQIDLLVDYAPRPGVEEFGTGTVEAHAERPIPVAARYDVLVESFTIKHTRAPHQDTVKIDLRGRVAGQRSASDDACSIVGPPNYCAINVAQGDFNDGVHPAKSVRVGPFDLIPEVTSDLVVEYNVLNFGTPYELNALHKILDGISDGTSAFLKAYYPQASSGWSSANDFTKKLNAISWGGCDGPVAVDAHVLLNKAIAGQTQSTLDARTTNIGRFSQTNGTYEIESQDGCGRSPRYDVTWSVIRTSWQP